MVAFVVGRDSDGRRPGVQVWGYTDVTRYQRSGIGLPRLAEEGGQCRVDLFGVGPSDVVRTAFHRDKRAVGDQRREGVELTAISDPQCRGGRDRQVDLRQVGRNRWPGVSTIVAWGEQPAATSKLAPAVADSGPTEDIDVVEVVQILEVAYRSLTIAASMSAKTLASMPLGLSSVLTGGTRMAPSRAAFRTRSEP